MKQTEIFKEQGVIILHLIHKFYTKSGEYNRANVRIGVFVVYLNLLNITKENMENILIKYYHFLKKQNKISTTKITSPR